jgi:LuxR family quorum-sensing transcriptional regulator LasR
MSSEKLPLASIDLMASILEAKDEMEFSTRLGNATRICGFEMFVIGLQVTNSDGMIEHHVTSAYPQAWQKLYSERNYVADDPTVAYCQNHTEPLIWSELMFKHAMPLFEEARNHGIGFGISVPIHERIGTKSMLSLVRDRPLDKDTRETAELLAAAKVLSSCAHFTASRLLSKKLNESLHPSLTPQEERCLRWVAKGKTSWEVGRIMGISEPTVVFHLKNLIKKLDVINRYQALAVAIRLGLID